MYRIHKNGLAAAGNCRSDQPIPFHLSILIEDEIQEYLTNINR